jgi:uncharacterized protein (TIGR02246 family)
MKSRLLVLLLMCFAIVPGARAQHDVADIRKVLTDQVEAWNSGSVEGYMKGYWESDSTMFVSGGNVVRGYKEVMARYKKSYNSKEKMGKLVFPDLAIRKIMDDVAIATGEWKLTRAKDTLGGRFTLVVEKKPAGWRIVYDHTSSAQ